MHQQLHAVNPGLCPPAPPGHSFSQDRLVGYALHRLPGAAQGPGQLHQDSGERNDPRRDDPQGEGGLGVCMCVHVCVHVELVLPTKAFEGVFIALNVFRDVNEYGLMC